MSKETPSSVKIQIHEIRRDVKQLEVVDGVAGQVLLGWWLNPLKNIVADPVLGFAENTVPAVTSVIPFSDHVVGFGLGVTSGLGHLAHSVGCHVGVFKQEKRVESSSCRGLENVQSYNNFAQDFEEFFQDNDKKHDNFFLVESIVGFTMDLIAMVLHAQRLSRWFKTLSDFQIFLKKSGIGLDILGGGGGGSVDLLPNMILLSRLQNRHVYSNKFPTREEINDGQYYIKYATAVYAMTAVDVADTQKKRIEGKQKLEIKQKSLYNNSVTNGLVKKFSLEREKAQMYTCDEPYEYEARTRICNHVADTKETDVVMFVKQGIVMRALRHFVAVNHVKKAVILSIRGTFSLNELLLMGSAELRNYCGGKAHSGIADQTDRLWYVVGDTIKARLKENQGYTLVITGHSLGGGVASLLTIKCYHEQLVGMTPVKCHCFASPAVYCPLDAAPKAVANTIGYIHDDDCVPFMSLANMKEFSQSIQTVQDTKTNPVTKLGMILGKREPPPELVKVVKRSTVKSRAYVNGVPKSYVPASRIVWMRGCPEDGYKAYIFDPRDLPEVHVDVDMFQDHSPSCYEEALQILAREQNWNASSLSKLAQIHSFHQDNEQVQGTEINVLE